MRKLVLIITVLIISLSGCDRLSLEKPVITIGKIKVSEKEFNEALQESAYRNGDEASRKEFLERFIARKLILLEAERMGLDKDPEFLKDIQLFWEQSLLKLALSKKIKELSLEASVSDEEIRRYYDNNKAVEFPDKELADVYDQIKWIVLNEKQREAVSGWADSLKNSVNITIDYGRLGLSEKQ